MYKKKKIEQLKQIKQLKKTNYLYDMNSFDKYSPEMIAREIFIKNPKDPCSYRIIPKQENIDLTYIFEILITILLEGLDILTNGLRNVDLTNFDSDHILSLNPWFNSLGFSISVDFYNDKNNSGNDSREYEEYYCKTIINNRENNTFFIMKNIEAKSYHFFLNGKFLESNRKKESLNELYGIFTTNDKIYKISFDFYKCD